PAGAIDFPATGQTTSYPAEKNDHVSAPVAVPDDGAVQAGATLSYTDNGDGTITDDNTGLMWEKKGDNGGLHDKDNGYVWTGTGTQETIWDWLDDVNAEGGTGFAGYDDWRVPNAKELQTLVNFQNSPPMTSGAFNANCVPGATVLTGSCTPMTGYTSSTTWARSTGMAWGVSFYEGLLFPYDKTSGLRVRAVRGGLSGPLPATGQTTAYAANKKGDNGGLHDKDNFYWWSGNGADETIRDWLEDVNAEAFAGRQDWRIPNARELLSIASFQNQWAVPAAFNNNCVPGATVLTGSCAFQSSYWTSTTRVSSVVGGTSIQAWYVDNYGSVYPYFKSGTFRVRAVRGGTP